METRAPYALIGLFVLAAIAAVFGFVYWLHNSAGFSERMVYRVRFENTVSGLLTGAAVLFNGIRVGEVTGLQLDPNDPRLVTATIAVAATTPVRADTKAGLDFQGLTGVPVVTLQGGSAPLDGAARARGEPYVLVADPSAGQSMTNVARDTLRRLDTILSDNAEPIRNTIANLNTFSGALSRNSDKLDGIVAGLTRMTGGETSSAPHIVYRSARREVDRLRNRGVDVLLKRGLHTNVPIGSDLVSGHKHSCGVGGHSWKIVQRTRLGHSLHQLFAEETVLARVVLEQRMNKSHAFGFEREPPVLN